MREKRPIVVFVLWLALLAPGVVGAQVPVDVWRTFAERMEVGVVLNVRLRSGQKFRATLIDARDDVVLLQPKTRIPVPVQPVPYGEIASLERAKGGIGAGKAVGIGVASGVGAFFGVLMLLFAAWGD
jgi:hypothetical protein